MCCDRRQFLKTGAQVVLACLFPVSALASIDPSLAEERTLFFYNTHTGERLDACYFAQGVYQTEALKTINHILRDHRTGEIKSIHISLLDLLYSVSTRFDNPVRFQIISGYRSPETNAMLCRTSTGVGKSSLHMEGKAADIRVSGYDTKMLQGVCMKLQAGGVGYYPGSDFVHVDIGPVRYW